MLPILYNRKGVSNFDFSLVFVVKIKLNIRYKKMTLWQEKYKSSFFQVLKVCKAFSNFDVNSSIRI